MFNYMYLNNDLFQPFIDESELVFFFTQVKCLKQLFILLKFF